MNVAVERPVGAARAAGSRIVVLHDFDPTGDVVADRFSEVLPAETGLPVVHLGRTFGQPRDPWRRLLRLLDTFYYPLTLSRRLGPDDHVICWQQNFGLCLAILWRLTGRRRRLYILNAAILPARQRGIVGALHDYAFGYAGLRALVAASAAEAETLARRFPGLRRPGVVQSILFASDVNPSQLLVDPGPLSDTPYFLATGRSNRKYGFFLRFFENKTQHRFKIINDTMKYEPRSASIEILRSVYGEDYIRYMRGAQALLLDLEDKTASAGHTVFVQALELGVPVVVTEAAVLAEYVIPGENCIQIEDENEAQLEAALEVLSDPARRERMIAFQRRDHAERFSLAAMARRIADLVRAAG